MLTNIRKVKFILTKMQEFVSVIQRCLYLCVCVFFFSEGEGGGGVEWRGGNQSLFHLFFVPNLYVVLSLSFDTDF